MTTDTMRCPDSSKPEVEMVINPNGIKVSDLKDQTGMIGPHPFLYCDNCGNEYSGNVGDYFMHKRDHVFECCDENMRLVRKVVQYIDVPVSESADVKLYTCKGCGETVDDVWGGLCTVCVNDA